MSTVISRYPNNIDSTVLDNGRIRREYGIYLRIDSIDRLFRLLYRDIILSERFLSSLEIFGDLVIGILYIKTYDLRYLIIVKYKSIISILLKYLLFIYFDNDASPFFVVSIKLMVSIIDRYAIPFIGFDFYIERSIAIFEIFYIN